MATLQASEGSLSMKIQLIGSAFLASLLLGAMPALATTAAAPAAARNYDCTKAGNANKTACRGVATAAPARPAPVARATPAPRNYDCAKAGNANKIACRGTAAAPAPRPAPAARVAAPAATHAPSAATHATGPQGATAKCKDNTYSHSATHSGACSHHGGVAQWY